jgi:hypothetical protein
MPELSGEVAGSGRTHQLNRDLLRDLVPDIAVVLGWFVAIGVVAAVVWWQVTPLAAFTRTRTSGQMTEAELGREVATDGWYFVIAAVGGLVSGVALLAMRRRDPLVMVVLVTLGALLASWLMLRIGLWLGPDKPANVLSHVAVGDKVPLQLKPTSKGVPFVWPITALLGAIGVIWGFEDRVHAADGSAAPNDGVSGTHSG